MAERQQQERGINEWIEQGYQTPSNLRLVESGLFSRWLEQATLVASIQRVTFCIDMVHRAVRIPIASWFGLGPME